MVLCAMLLALVISIVTCPLVAAQGQLELRACRTITYDPSQQTVMQFERETFPPFADTGLFETQGEQLLYVERGQLTLFSDRSDAVPAGQDESFIAPPNSVFGVLNENPSQDASLLWLRLGQSSQLAEPLAFLAPSALRTLTGMVQDEPPQPLFIEFSVPEIERNTSITMFIAAMNIAPSETLLPADLGSSQSLTTTGRIAVVVESGQVEIVDGLPLSVAQGEWIALDGDLPHAIRNPSDSEVATGFIVGLVEYQDSGWISAELSLSDCQ